jgi:hypothetical protein
MHVIVDGLQLPSGVEAWVVKRDANKDYWPLVRLASAPRYQDFGPMFALKGKTSPTQEIILVAVGTSDGTAASSTITLRAQRSSLGRQRDHLGS